MLVLPTTGTLLRPHAHQDLELMQFGTLKIMLAQQLRADAELGQARKHARALKRRCRNSHRSRAAPLM